MCRRRHAEALEWAWFLNAHLYVVDVLMYGDKDTWRLAFALAGASQDYYQVCTCSAPAMEHALGATVLKRLSAHTVRGWQLTSVDDRLSSDSIIC